MARMRTLLFAFIVVDILVIGFVMLLVSKCCNGVYSTARLLSTDIFNSTVDFRQETHEKSICEPDRLLGRMEVNPAYVPAEWEAIQSAGVNVQHGCYEPTDCVANQSLAIIVPFKNRDQHLLNLLRHLHPVLQRQKLRYCVFVPEQYDDGAFNKARVMNAGVLEILKSGKYDFDCLIFNDVDMLVEDDRNLHRCQELPSHLSPAIDKFNYTVDYGTQFGGVGAIKTDQYILINGHSNRFYGWGGEDTDLETRLHLNNIDSVPVDADIGRYKMIPHDHPLSFNPATGLGSFFNSLNKEKRRRFRFKKSTDESGLSTIKYLVKNVQNHTLYTKFTLDVRVFLIRNASSSFDGFNHKIEVENPFLTNAKAPGQPRGKVFGFGIEDTLNFHNLNCSFRHFDNKIVDKVLGLDTLERYNTIYRDLETAKSVCLAMSHECSSVLERSPDHYVVRSNQYVHDKILRYKTGPVHERLASQVYEGRSVVLKVCPKDARFLQFLYAPIQLEDSDYELRSVSHQSEFDLRMYQTESFHLYYSYSIYSSHRAVVDHSETVLNQTILSFSSLNVVSSDKLLVFNSTDNSSYFQFLGNHETLRDVAEKQGIIRVRTPSMSNWLFPGCYICESSVVDQNFVTHLKWKWWFEVRASSDHHELTILNKYLPKAEVSGTGRTQQLWALFRGTSTGNLPFGGDEVLWSLIKSKFKHRFYQGEV